MIIIITYIILSVKTMENISKKDIPGLLVKMVTFGLSNSEDAYFASFSGPIGEVLWGRIRRLLK